MTNSYPDLSEDDIRDYLSANLYQLPELISNLDEFRLRLEDSEREFLQISPDHGGPTSTQLINYISMQRVLSSVECLYDLRLIGTEHELLNTGHAGFQPRSDILAYNSEMGTLYLLEVKQGQKTEREAITELSAYSQGLQNRSWGLSPVDFVWIPIAEEWRTTVHAGFAYQTMWNRVKCLPLRYEIQQTRGQISSVSLELLDLIEPIPDAVAFPVFAWDTYDTFVIAMEDNPGDASELLTIIASAASQLGLSGFILRSDPARGNELMCPYQLLIGAYNPHKGQLKRLQLQTVFEHDGDEAMRREVKQPLWHGHDFDIQSEEEYWHTWNFFSDPPPEDPARISLEEIAFSASNRFHWLWKEIQPWIEMFSGTKYELSTPSLTGLVNSGDYFRWQRIQDVAYFGLMNDAVMQRLKYEHHYRSEYGDGPVFGDLGLPWESYSHPLFWEGFMQLMNFQHDSQPESDELVDEEE